MVYEFCKKRPWLFVLKGIKGDGKTLIEDDAARRRRLRNKRKKSFTPFLVSDEAAKALLTQRLKLEAPRRDDTGVILPRPGYLHFPQEPAFDDEFFAQLTSNRLVEKNVRRRLVREWTQTRIRNEAYDCYKYALAGLPLSKTDPAQFALRHAGKAQKAADAAPPSIASAMLAARNARQ